MISITIRNFFSHHWLQIFFLMGTCGIFFFYTIAKLFVQTDTGNITTLIWPVSGDWGMHLAQVQAFAHHNFLDVLLNNPIYSSTITAYPFVINFISGKFLQLTGGLEFSMLLPLYILTPFLLGGLYLLLYQLISYKWAAVVGVFVFFLGGGTAFVLSSAAPFSEMDGFHQNIFLEEHGYFWKSFFTTLIFPQRALFLGLTVGSFLLWKFFAWRTKNFDTIGWKKLFFLGLVMGLLAVVHTHTFLFFALFGVFFSLLDYKNFLKYIVIALGAAVTSLPFVWLILQGEGETFSFIFHIRWMDARFEENFFIFWVRNWGLVFIGAVMLLGEIFYKFFVGDTHRVALQYQEKFFLASVCVFITANIVQFQNNPWDNGKIFVWVFIIWIAVVLRRIFSIHVFVGARIYRAVIAVLFTFFCTISGVFLLAQNFIHERVHIFSQYERDLAQEFSQKISPDDLVLTPDYHLFFVSTLTGNSIVMGYRGWLGSYGIDYSQRERDIQKIYAGHKKALQLIAKHHIDVIVIDPRLLPQHWKINKKFFEENFSFVFAKGGVEVWKVE